MATAVDMGEVDELHSRDDNIKDAVVTNGEVIKDDIKESDSAKKDQVEMHKEAIDNSDEVMEVDSDNDSDDDDEETDQLNNGVGKDYAVENHARVTDKDEDVQEIVDEDIEMKEGSEEIKEIDDDDDDDDDDEEDDDNDEKDTVKTNKCDKDKNDNTSVATDDLNDSGENDVMIIENDAPKENGQLHAAKSDDNETTVISDDGDDSSVAPPPVSSTKTKKQVVVESPRRSARNRSKKSYVENERDDSDESDIEEVVPEDPLAIQNDVAAIKRNNRLPGATIVVKDTKRLVEIASKTNPSSSGKKEPTLVIIDTNSILSGRGPVPLVPKPAITTNYPSLLPAAVPAQGVYPPNMRATITPIPPMTTHSSKSVSSHSSSHTSSTPTILPSLTDDMFVVEAPSFIVPYVYEKPPLKDFRDYLKELEKEINEQKKKEAEQRKKDAEENKKDDADEKVDGESDGAKSDVEEQTTQDNEETNKETQKLDNYLEEERKSYFESPLCKFFIDIGNNLVEEFVQTDLLKQQKRKRDREQGQNTQTNNTIKSLLKSLEFSKENNEPFKVDMKKCEFCTFKTESLLTMAFHLETPHMKNYIYKCNFCQYEIRSPHDILFHMEAEHAIRGRLERAPAFHQCPNCPFEDNQKSKLSRHLVACMRKFRPEKNLEPPLDWEPPAKIPRVHRIKQTMNNKAAALYQMTKQPSLYDFAPKMQQNNALNRGRGRPTLGGSVKQQPMIRSNPAMIYKHSMSGGSVLLPTNYQMSGNHIYQVVGGQDLGGRIINSGSPMALVPNLSAAMQQQNSPNKKPLHQPSISITPLPRGSSSSSSSSNSSPVQHSKPGDSNSKNSFVICEICDGYIKDLEQLRNHMQWIHKVKIHPKMIYNRPPLNCQKCQFRFFTDQGLERHLLGSHGLVTSSMQEAANKSKDAGRCPVCGRVYQWKLLNHVARDHNMTLKPAHLSYKCTVCTATFGMYKLFENHVYSAHSVVAKRVMDKKGSSTTTTANSGSSSNMNSSNNSKSSETLLKPLKINDEITIIPQQPKSSNNNSSAAGTSKEGSSNASTVSQSGSSSSSKSASGPSTSKSVNEEANSSLSRAERLARRKSAVDI